MASSVPEPKIPGYIVERRKNPSTTPIWGGDPDCAHEFIMIKLSGYECNSCHGAYCE